MRIKNFHTIKMQDDKDSTQYLLIYTANTAAKGLQIAIEVNRAKNENGSNVVHSYYVELQSEAYNPWKQTFEIDGKYYAGCDKFRNIDGYATSAQARKELRVFIADIIAHCEKEEQITSGMVWHLEKHFQTRKLTSAQLDNFIADYKDQLKTTDIRHDVTASNIAKIDRLIREIQEDLANANAQTTTDTTEPATEPAPVPCADAQAATIKIILTENEPDHNEYDILVNGKSIGWIEAEKREAFNGGKRICEYTCFFIAQKSPIIAKIAGKFYGVTFARKTYKQDGYKNARLAKQSIIQFIRDNFELLTDIDPEPTDPQPPTEPAEPATEAAEPAQATLTTTEPAEPATEPTYWQTWDKDRMQCDNPTFEPQRGAVTTPGGYVPHENWAGSLVWTVDGIRFEIMVKYDHVAGCDWGLPCSYTIKCGSYSATFDVQGSWLSGCGCDAMWRHGHTNAKQALYCAEQWAYNHLKTSLTTIVFGRLGCYTANVPRPVQCYGFPAQSLSDSSNVLTWKHKRIFTPTFIKKALGWLFKNDRLFVDNLPNKSKEYARRALNALENTQVYWDTNKKQFVIFLPEFFNHYFECANARIIRALIKFPYKLC